MTDETKKETEQPKQEKKIKKSKKGVWTVIGIIVLVLVIAGGAGGGYLLHLSNTSPEFCATCHIMDFNVTSYLTSNNLDNIHNQANVECKECHDYPVKAEVTSGIKYILGDYTVDSEGKLLPVTYGDDMCLQCHISYDYIAEKTDYLSKNPHKSHNGDLPCKTCHVSHGEQIDYCSQCHDNGGQEMIGAD
jgi:nitrate/TMAO reductase-like tetraheme cytochrome c subunit